MLPWQQFDVGCDYIHNLYTVLAKTWERWCTTLCNAISLRYGQRNAIKSQICFDFCVSTTLLKYA